MNARRPRTSVQTSTSPLRLVGLIRVSGQTQKAHDTPETQRAAIMAIARGNNAELVDVFEVVGSVSDLAKTPQWASIIALLAQGDTHLAVYATDRLARPMDWGTDWVALEALRALHVMVYFPGGKRDLGSEEGQLVTTMEAVIAGGERRRIAKRTRDGKRRHVSAGHWVGGSHRLPTGITYTRKTHTWGYSGDADKVKMVFDLVVNHGLSYYAIAQRIGMTSGGVINLIGKPIYRGIYISEYHDDPTGVRVFGGAGQLPQLIPDATWEAAQGIASRRSTKRQKSLPDHDQPDYVYSGVVYSAYEPLGEVKGGFYRPDLSKPSQHTVYTFAVPEGTMMACRCLGSVRCGLRSWAPAERLVHVLDTYLAKVTAEDSFVAHLLHQVEQSKAEQTGRDVEGERSALQARLDDVTSKLDRLTDLYLDGGLDRDRFDRKRSGLKADEDAIRLELKSLESIAPMVAPTERDLRTMARALSFNPSWDVQTKRAWLERFGIHIRLSNDAVETCIVVFPPTLQEDGEQEIHVPTSVGLGRLTWDDLLGYDPTDHHTWLEHERGLYRVARAAEVLGVDSNRLYYLIRRGYVQPPQTKVGKVAYWTLEDIEKARVALAKG